MFSARIEWRTSYVDLSLAYRSALTLTAQLMCDVSNSVLPVLKVACVGLL